MQYSPNGPCLASEGQPTVLRIGNDLCAADARLGRQRTTAGGCVLCWMGNLRWYIIKSDKCMAGWLAYGSSSYGGIPVLWIEPCSALFQRCLMRCSDGLSSGRRLREAWRCHSCTICVMVDCRPSAPGLASPSSSPYP
jgi:hypothetical protein